MRIPGLAWRASWNLPEAALTLSTLQERKLRLREGRDLAELGGCLVWMVVLVLRGWGREGGREGRAW